MDELENLPDDEMPELLFFDTDDVPEEADFIRIDDLFRSESEYDAGREGLFTFVLFPRKIGQFIRSRMALLLRRTMLLLAARGELHISGIRVRPMYVQWQSELNGPDESESIVREICSELEMQAANLTDMAAESRFWAGSCFVYPAENEYSDDYLNRLIGSYQEE